MVYPPNLNGIPFGIDGIDMNESDLYLPLKRFLESQKYEVKGEVQGCDVLAIRGIRLPTISRQGANKGTAREHGWCIDDRKRP